MQDCTPTDLVWRRGEVWILFWSLEFYVVKYEHAISCGCFSLQGCAYLAELTDSELQFQVPFFLNEWTDARLVTWTVTRHDSHNSAARAEYKRGLDQFWRRLPRSPHFQHTSTGSVTFFSPEVLMVMLNVGVLLAASSDFAVCNAVWLNQDYWGGFCILWAMFFLVCYQNGVIPHVVAVA